LYSLAAGNKVAKGYIFFLFFFFLAICFTRESSSFLINHIDCDQAADRRRVKSIPTLTTEVWHE